MHIFIIHYILWAVGVEKSKKASCENAYKAAFETDLQRRYKVGHLLIWL